MGDPVTQYVRRQKFYPVGRICESPGCTTILSIYNQDHICAPCEGNLSLEDKFPGVMDRRLLHVQRKFIASDRKKANA